MSDVALSETEAGVAFVLPPIAFSEARRTGICFAGFELSARVNLHACIASGIDALLQRSLKAAAFAMRVLTRPPLPDMLAKI
jgi:hypothetical protein